MLAEMVEHVIGMDPDRDWVTASIVDASTTRELASTRLVTTGICPTVGVGKPVHIHDGTSVGGRGRRQLRSRRGQLPHCCW